MATMEKLIKAFDALKMIQSPNANDEVPSSKKKDGPPTKKDKIMHCTTIVDAICSPNLRSVSDFPKFLGVAVETFLLFCDDNDSDVRLMAGECLNKTIKTLLESHLGRLQVELYKEIKKDGSSRSLRAALSRFADVCHLIRPQKCRPYTMNLLPCLMKISLRIEEEPVQETLAQAMGKIMPSLGKFTNDTEIKLLLKAFLPNLISGSAAIRRTAATSLICICQYSRKPTTFFVWLMSSLLEYLIPVQEERAIHIILGVLLCLRHLVPHLSDQERQIVLKGSIGVKQKEENIGISSDQLLQVYELLLFYTQHCDHNVVAASLEALHQILRSPPKQLIPFLLDPAGIHKSRIYVADPELRLRCASQGSVMPESTSEDEAALEDEPEITPLGKEEQIYNVDVFSENCPQSFSNNDTGISPEEETDNNSEYSNPTVGSCSESSSPVTTHKPNFRGSPGKVRKEHSDEKHVDEESDKDGLWEHISSSSSPVTKEEFKIENVGAFTDVDVPLKYCSRVLCSRFLLAGFPGELMPDQKVRVSVKALALSCMSGVLTLYPQSFFLPLHVFEDCTKSVGECQRICDILKYSSHSDPHLKGHTAILLGVFLKCALKEAGGWWEKSEDGISNSSDAYSIEELVTKLLSIVEDKSAVASRLGLTAVKHCLPIILQSVYGHLALRILDSLLMLKENPYWLVKVEMLNIIADIPFKIVHHMESKWKNQVNNGKRERVDYQDRFLRHIFLPLLGDEDFRVRHAAAQAVVRMVPKLFHPIDHDYQDPIIALAKEETAKYLCSILHSPFSPGVLPLVHALVKPFDQEKTVPYCVSTESALSRIINLLCCTLLTSAEKHLTFGCCQSLYYLAEEYLVTVFTEAWRTMFGGNICIAKHISQSSLKQQASVSSTVGKSECHLNRESNILCHILHLVTDTHVALDLVAHRYILQLLGNLMAGACYHSLQRRGTDNASETDEKWSMLKDHHLVPTFDQLFAHILRVLNIFTHILEEQSPSASAKSGLPSLPSAPSLSPIKRKGKLKDDVPNSPSSLTKSSPNKAVQEKTDMEKEKSSSKTPAGIGQFFTHPLYMRLYEILKGAYSSYKISLELQTGEKFTGLLQACLDTLSQLLEVSNSKEMAKYADEILSYLKSVLSIEACAAVQCIRQLLKSLFGTNLISLWEEPQQLSPSSKKPGYATRLTTAVAPGLYHNCVTSPYAQFTHAIASSSARPTGTDNEEMGSWLSWMRKRSEKKLSILLKSGSKGDKASLAAHIRLFETAVIKALKQYTVTSNVHLQCQVLDLLAQLVQLRVNYCLLDSDQIFIGFVIKQFEYIEEGQIPFAELLIPKIFYFLVLLSYERYHSKVIIGVPKIIQLCDGLMASGQPPDKYAIPALQPIVEDLFLLRGSNKLDSGKELDTQKEVVVSMLLRLVHYPQVLDLFLAILHQSYKEGEDRWKKLSRQIVDIVLPLLSKQQLHLDEQVHLETLHHLCDAVAPSVFRPADILLKALFIAPQKLTDCPNLHRWMCLILAILRVLISQGKEEVVLSRLSDLGFVIVLPKYGVSPPAQFSHPLCVEDIMIKSCTNDNSSSPEDIFSRFLFQVAGILVKAIHEQVYTLTCDNGDLNFLCQQMAELLLYFMHMFQSGMFRRVATSAMLLIKQETKGIDETSVNLYSVSEISQLFIDLAAVYPTLVLQWCNVLTLLNCDNQNFWTQILRPSCHSPANASSALPNTTSDVPTMTSCNLEMTRKGGIILLCDYMCENLNDAEQMTWLIVNYINDLIQLSSETPVQDFISSVHRNPAASGLFIQAIHARCDDLSKPSFVKKTLRCLEAIHPTQRGSLLTLLITKFLPTNHLATARQCDSLACCLLELLLSKSLDTVTEQLSVEDIDKLLSEMKTTGIFTRHKRLVSLLERIRSLLQSEPAPTETPLPLVLPVLKDVVVNKDWYLNCVREQCFSTNPSLQECAQLLSKLRYEDALSVMAAKEFHLPILQYCLELGVQLTISASCKQSPVGGPIASGSDSLECPIYVAAKTTLLQHIIHLSGLLPQPHQAFLLQSDAAKQRPTKHHNQLISMFSDTVFWDVLFQVIPVATCYLETLSTLPGQQEVPVDSLEDIARLTILSAEAITWMLETKQRISSEYQHITLKFVDAALKETNVSFVIGLQNHATWISSAVSAIYLLVKHLQRKEDLPSISFQKIFQESEINIAQQACMQMSELVKWLEDTNINMNGVPEFMMEPLTSVIIGLARSPLVNSFTRTPPILWQLGWTPELGGEYKTSVPPPPGEYLQERDVLKQYIYRINLLGWTSRQQFEETWMALLGVLSATPLTSTEAREEDMERVRTSCLAVKSITSLLLRTLLLPEPGNPQNSNFLMQARDKPLAFLHTRCGKKLLAVKLPIHKKLQEMLKLRNGMPMLSTNTERVASHLPYFFSQVSMEYLCVAVGIIDDWDETEGSASSSSSHFSASTLGTATYHQREQCLAAAGLDIHSCLHFLLDLYSQWLSSEACPNTPLILLTEVTRSVVILSDIFMERAQYEWMLDTLLEVQRVHPAEDEIITQYLIFGICKAAAVLGMEQDMLERLKKLIELSLKSAFLPTLVATLYGLLHLLEQGNGEENFPLLSTASEYILKHFGNSVMPNGQNEDHVLVMWAVAIYIIENYQDDVVENEFGQKIFEAGVNIFSSTEDVFPNSIYLAVLHGLERLLLTDALSEKEIEVLMKLSVDRIRHGSPLRALAALSLLLSCMYVGKGSETWPSETPSNARTTLPTNSYADVATQTDPEQLIAAMERVTTLFDRIKRGFPFEVEAICNILPLFLMDFFPAQDVMNKVIGEFLSSQQPHPQLLAGVVFQVFQHLHQQSQEDVIYDWVMLSLSNFTQRYPVAMAVWSLTCFFVSASTLPWLQALFPHLQNRMGKMEMHDRKLFCIAGLQFKNQLKDDEHRKSFVTTIKTVARPDSPYADLLNQM